MAKNLTTADKCLTLLVAVLVITNIILACSIGLILPRHITKDGWIYIDNMEGATNESLRISCTCIRTIVTRKNETSEESEEEGSKRRLECLMDGTGFKCLNHLSRNQSHNSSIETIPNEDIKFEPQNSSVITKSIRVISVMEKRGGELSSSHEVLRKNITLSKPPRDSLVNNSTISSITTSYHTEKPSILARWYLSTLSGKVGTLSNNVVVSKESPDITGKYSYVRVSQETTHHMTGQTMSMKRITPEHAEKMAVQVEPMSKAVLRNHIISSKLIKDSLVNNSGIPSTTSYHTQKPSYLRSLYPATPSGEVAISSNNVVVPKEPVETLETGGYSYSLISQETTHHMTDQTMSMKTITPYKPIGEYTQHHEQITVLEKPSSVINNSSSTKPFSELGENLSSTFNTDNLNNAGT